MTRQIGGTNRSNYLVKKLFPQFTNRISFSVLFLVSPPHAYKRVETLQKKMVNSSNHDKVR